jgi:hypothetical protein
VRYKLQAGIGALVLGCVPLLAGCGSSSHAAVTTTSSSSSTTVPAPTATLAPATSSPSSSTTAQSDATSPTTASTVPDHSSSALPVGAATGFPFGSTNDQGTQISLLPPNAGDVNQASVAAAPKVGPFRIDPNAGPAGWPDACKLTNVAQLKALFPAITGLSGAPVGTKAQILGGSGGNTPNNTQCTWNLTTKFDPPGYSDTPTHVEIQLEEIDSDAPSIWLQEQQQQAAQATKYPAQYANYPHLAGGVACFDDGNELQCLKGDIDYWVDGQKVTGGNYTGSDNAVWIDQIELPLAEVLGAEFSS